MLKLMIWIYDLETYKDAFIGVFKNKNNNEIRIFEISQRKNDYSSLVSFLYNQCKGLIGFNNINFDYPILHYILENNNITSEVIYNKANELINSEWSSIPDWLIKIPQLDLYKIWHFDNKAKRTSLKWCEFFLRWPNLMDLPYKPEDNLTNNQIEEIVQYCINDVNATYKLYEISKDKIYLRKLLGEQYNLDLQNANDPKIGAEIFTSIISKENNISQKQLKSLRTYRDEINLSDCIVDYINFESDEFNTALEYFKNQTVYNGEIKGILENSVRFAGLDYDFGAGGIHGSLNGIFEADDEYEIIDIDVASYYPNLAIKNKFYPEHLGEGFCDIYLNVYNTRKRAKKKAKANKKDTESVAINAGLKLALNGTYGKSNDKYSYFYDTSYTLKTTINGQLLLCMLAEQLVYQTNCEVIQINTDGLTIKVLRRNTDIVKSVCNWWENLTQLELEYADYSKMVVRDVNNYIAQTTSGYCKYKGVFEIDKEVAGEPALHKNNSLRIIPITLSEYFINNVPIKQTIRNHNDIYDFCIGMRARGEWTFKLINQTNKETQLQKTIRYYISSGCINDSCGIIKKYNKEDGRESYLEAHPIRGRYWKQQLFNKAFIFDDIKDYNIKYEYYERECRKIINQIEKNQLTLF